MTEEQKKLKRISLIVKDMWEKINDYSSGYYVKDLSNEVESLVFELDLDTLFVSSEIKCLEKAGFTLSKDNKIATKTFKGVTISIEKRYMSEYTMSEYNMGFGKGKSNTITIYDLTDAVKANFLNKYITRIKK